MYKSYNLKLKEADFLELNRIKPFASVFKKNAIDNSLIFKDFVDKFNISNNEIGANIEKILEEDIIDGNQLINEWFPEIKADIFLSHSHQDEKLAIEFSAWIKKNFNLTVFIDSTVWKYSDDLLEIIDNEYCRNKKSDTYNYKKRNLSTSHIHLILSTAITKMIDQCECLIFLNTPSSVSIKNSFSEGGNLSKTHSPWIYNELFISSIIRKQCERKSILIHEDRSFTAQEKAEKTLDISYPATLDHMFSMDKNTLNSWIKTNENNDKKHPLDILYSLSKM